MKYEVFTGVFSLLLRVCNTQKAQTILPTQELYTKQSTSKSDTDFQSSLQVQDTGVTNLDPGSIALVLYIIVYNPKTLVASVEVTYENCCIQENHGHKDCSIMKLYGGFKGNVSPKETKTVTLLYPTLYPYDLVGSCILLLKMESLTKIIKVQFNTTLEYQKPITWLPEFLNEYLFDTPIPKPCRSRDEDRFNDCSPVMCDIKYHGQRNHFDQKTRLCTEVPECTGNDKDTPFMVYDSKTNTCKNLSRSLVITKEDKKILEVPSNDDEDFKIVNWMVERRLDCNQGVLAPNNSTCICHPGWESLVLPEQDIDRITGLLQMCNRGKKGYWKHIVAGISIAVVMIVLINISNPICRRGKKKCCRKNSPEISSVKTAGCFQTLHRMYDPKPKVAVIIEEETFELEQKGIVGRSFFKICRFFVPVKKNNLDFSIEEISVGTTLLSPVSLEGDYEID